MVGNMIGTYQAVLLPPIQSLPHPVVTLLFAIPQFAVPGHTVVVNDVGGSLLQNVVCRATRYSGGMAAAAGVGADVASHLVNRAVFPRFILFPRYLPHCPTPHPR